MSHQCLWLLSPPILSLAFALPFSVLPILYSPVQIFPTLQNPHSHIDFLMQHLLSQNTFFILLRIISPLLMCFFVCLFVFVFGFFLLSLTRLWGETACSFFQLSRSYDDAFFMVMIRENAELLVKMWGNGCFHTWLLKVLLKQ